MGEKTKLFCWLALKLEGRLNWINYSTKYTDMLLNHIKFEIWLIFNFSSVTKRITISCLDILFVTKLIVARTNNFNCSSVF